jgi:dUTP pyrophosphatase
VFKLIPLHDHIDMSQYRYATKLSSGIDLRANLLGMNLDPPGELLVWINQPTTISTGLTCKFERTDIEAQVRSRGGLAAKHGIFVLNSPGTIDADYEGEIKVILCNTTNVPFKIIHGDRIAQLVIVPIIRIEEYMSDTYRGDGHFSSTGIS